MSDALVLVANARLPSERAQSLQVVHAAASFARAGFATTLLHAARYGTRSLPSGSDLFSHYGVPDGARPQVRAVRCVDWIDRVPRALQFVPARVQELTFSRNAARVIAEEHAGGVVISREIECARALLKRGHGRVFLEIHRVPGGATRRAWLREAGERTRGVIAISGGVRDDLLGLGIRADAVLVAHDAFEPTLFARVASRDAARDELAVPRDAKLVVYTGGLLQWKGVDLLVDAMRELADARLVIAGGMQADVERLRERARGLTNVRIDGFQPPARVATYLAAADVAVIPNRSTPAISARYTSPLKLFEAMAAGCALVASDLPSLRELVMHDVDAWLVAPDSSAALAAGLRRVLDDRALRGKLATSLRARASGHTWDARAERIATWIRARSS